MSILLSALLALALIVGGFLLGRSTVEPEPPVGVVSTRLVVPAACQESLDDGDDLVLLIGEAVGIAARGERDLTEYLRRAVPAVEQYQRTARRCRALQTGEPVSQTDLPRAWVFAGARALAGPLVPWDVLPPQTQERLLSDAYRCLDAVLPHARLEWAEQEQE